MCVRDSSQWGPVTTGTSPSDAVMLLPSKGPKQPSNATRARRLSKRAGKRSFRASMGSPMRSSGWVPIAHRLVVFSVLGVTGQNMGQFGRALDKEFRWPISYPRTLHL